MPALGRGSREGEWLRFGFPTAGRKRPFRPVDERPPRRACRKEADTNLRDEQCFTWSVQGGAEVDLVIQTGSGHAVGIEFKAADAPRQTRSMTAAIESLELSKLIVVYPGDKGYRIGDTVEAVSIRNLGRIRELLT